MKIRIHAEKGGGGKKWAKICGRHLWMAPRKTIYWAWNRIVREKFYKLSHIRLENDRSSQN